MYHMTATGHAIIGTVIAAKIGNPYIAVPIAFASHFLADMVPHWDTGTHYRKKSAITFFLQTFLDVMFGFILAGLVLYYIFPFTNPLYALLIIVVAQLPDWMMAPYVFFKMKKFPFSKWSYDIQTKLQNKQDKPWGIINQVAILLLLIFIARLF